MIRFQCAQCFKTHSISDHLAGLPGKCGRCGYRFVAPGTPLPAPTSVFTPAAAPDPFADDLDLAGDVRRGWGGAIQAVVLGLILAILLVGFTWHFRDTLVVAHPGLEPLLPPKVAKVRAVPPPAPVAPVIAPVVAPPAVALLGPAPAGQTDWSVLGAIEGLGQLIIGLGLSGVVLGLAVVGPLVVPPVLSRLGWLSVSRWAILACLSLFLFAVSFALMFATFPGALISRGLTPFDLVKWVVSPSFWGVIGCALAAAISPKATGG